MVRAAATMELIVGDVIIEDEEDGYKPIRMITNRGEVQGRYYAVPRAQVGVVWVGGAGGGWDTPACNLYPRLCKELQGRGVASLRLRFRDPHKLEEATLDVLAGLSFLAHQDIDHAALVGHSFGGAVVLQAAASVMVRTVVPLATQSYGASVAADLAPRCSILLIHGTADRVLATSCSQYVYEIAGEPKKLILHDGANHGLDEVADDVRHEVRDWILQQFDIGNKS